MDEKKDQSASFPADRRKFVRIKTSLQFKFKSLAQFEHLFDASTGDLSLGGMFIKAKHTKPVGTKIEMELPCAGELLKISGTVRSIRYNGDTPVGMGIEFDALDEKAIDILQLLIHKHSME